jgi:hypothetical protein
MSILKELEQELQNIMEQAGYKVEKIALEESNRPDLGEYQLNDAMPLAKTYHENPHDIATKIVAEIEKNPHYTNINIAGPGFINISLSEDYICEILNRMKTDIYSNIDMYGQGGWSWYTGSAGWYYICLIKYILGIIIEKHKLRFEPHVPNYWNECSITIKLGGSVYNIKLKNKSGNFEEIYEVILDGKIIENKLIELNHNNQIHNVEVIM